MEQCDDHTDQEALTMLVLGLDQGGTGCRAALATDDGDVLATAFAAGTNPSTDPHAAAAGLDQALRHVLDLAGRDPGQIGSAVLGSAGYMALRRSPARDLLDDVWARTTIAAPLVIRPDSEIAFVAGTPEPDGVLVLAGTGSVVARLRDRTVVERRGGHGWLLGDEGSGFWLGREALRMVVGKVERGIAEGADPFVDEVLAAVLAGTGAVIDRSDVVGTVSVLCSTAAVDKPSVPVRLAPLVCAAADRGDPTATEVIERGARLLAELAEPLREPGRPVVLAGGLLAGAPAQASPLARRLRPLLDTPGSGPVAATGTGAAAAVGAAWLAALTAGVANPVGLHTALLGPPVEDQA